MRFELDLKLESGVCFFLMACMVLTTTNVQIYSQYEQVILYLVSAIFLFLYRTFCGVIKNLQNHPFIPFNISFT